MDYGWGTVAGVVLSWFSPKQRIRRMKDELEKFTQERNLLLIQKCDGKKAGRLVYLDRRIDELTRLLRNSATE